MNVLLYGTGYFPFRTAGEKNFFYEVLPLLQKDAVVSVASLNDRVEDVLWQNSSGGAIPVYCLRRPFHRDYSRFFFAANGYTAYHHRHRPLWEVVEKFVATARHLGRLRRIVRERAIDVIHFMDNFGFGMPLVREFGGGPRVTFTAANYDPRGQQSRYDAYLRLVLARLDGVGVYTRAYERRLRTIGVLVPLRPLNWGVTMPPTVSGAERRNMRRRFGVADNEILLLWSGWLQQIGENDFYRTVAVARALIEQMSHVHVIFAFKPESHRPAYDEVQGGRLQVHRGVPEFCRLLSAADFLLSPIGALGSTVSPPLTWLEAMSRGTPVVTTLVGGVDELIDDGRNGYVAKGYEDLLDTLVRAVCADNRAAVARSAVEVVQQSYSIESSAESYLALWREVLEL